MNSLKAPVLARYVLFIRPTRINDVGAYYGAVAITILRKAFGISCSVSDHVHKPLRVRCDRVVFGIRPGTDDLAMVALSVDPQRATRFFQPRVGDVVVDVGANVGGYALRSARMAEHVIAIEPEPSNYAQLTENVRLNHFDNVIPMHAAVSDSRGRGVLHLARDSGRHSLEADAWGKAMGQSVAVQITTLDDVVSTHGIQRIDWLKVDVERHELSVLNGGPHALDITQHLILEFELAKLRTISAVLQEHGLEILWYDAKSQNSILIARCGPGRSK